CSASRYFGLSAANLPTRSCTSPRVIACDIVGLLNSLRLPDGCRSVIAWRRSFTPFLIASAGPTRARCATRCKRRTYADERVREARTAGGRPLSDGATAPLEPFPGAEAPGLHALLEPFTPLRLWAFEPLSLYLTPIP